MALVTMALHPLILSGSKCVETRIVHNNSAVSNVVMSQLPVVAMVYQHRQSCF